MSDLISRQAVIDSLKEHRALYCDNTPETFSKLSYAEKSRVDELDTAIATIINLPSAENKGEWVKIQSGDKDFSESIVCSKCKNENSHLDFNEHKEPIGKVFVTSKFCPNCGADMRKSEKPETCKGCLEPCIMYEPDMRACKKKVREVSE